MRRLAAECFSGTIVQPFDHLVELPLSDLGAGFRLILHGLAAESLHATLREYKRNQNASQLAGEIQ